MFGFGEVDAGPLDAFGAGGDDARVRLLNAGGRVWLFVRRVLQLPAMANQIRSAIENKIPE